MMQNGLNSGNTQTDNAVGNPDRSSPVFRGERATTIPKGSTPKRVEKGRALLQGDDIVSTTLKDVAVISCKKCGGCVLLAMRLRMQSSVLRRRYLEDFFLKGYLSEEKLKAARDKYGHDYDLKPFDYVKMFYPKPEADLRKLVGVGPPIGSEDEESAASDLLVNGDDLSASSAEESIDDLI